jgi:hypothetical protein
MRFRRIRKRGCGRLCGDQGGLIRARLRREKAMKLALPPSPGRA